MSKIKKIAKLTQNIGYMGVEYKNCRNGHDWQEIMTHIFLCWETNIINTHKLFKFTDIYLSILKKCCYYST